MEEETLAQLTSEQLAALDGAHKAIFCTLDATDQAFFARTFKPKDLPAALERKAEIMKREQSKRERLAQLEAAFARSEAETASGGGEDLLAGAAAALGVGGAAALAVTDNTAFFQGVRPADLLPPLRTEFQSGKTGLSASGSADALQVTIHLGPGQVPAMTINLTALENGCEVKVNDLSARGVVESIKAGGEKLIGLAGAGLDLLRGDLLSGASGTLREGAGLAETVSELKLKERAWKVIKTTAEAMEAAYLDQREKERASRALLEKAWDNFYHCPTCGVAFGGEDHTCRVCGTSRPEKPVKADPRQP